MLSNGSASLSQTSPTLRGRAWHSIGLASLVGLCRQGVPNGKSSYHLTAMARSMALQPIASTNMTRFVAAPEGLALPRLARLANEMTPPAFGKRRGHRSSGRGRGERPRLNTVFKLQKCPGAGCIVLSMRVAPCLRAPGYRSGRHAGWTGKEQKNCTSACEKNRIAGKSSWCATECQRSPLSDDFEKRPSRALFICLTPRNLPAGGVQCAQEKRS
jgi:hypothetical protein